MDERFADPKFKIGDTIVCVRKPDKNSYQCEIGDVFTIKKYYTDKSSRNVFIPEDRPIRDIHSWCARDIYFERAVSLKKLYNKE